MLKVTDSMKGLEERAGEALRAILEGVPVVEIETIEMSSGHAPEVDIRARLRVGPNAFRLVCEVKSIGQPRYVRAAILQLLDASQALGATPVLIAPYLSPTAQALCREHGVSFVDLAGNARLAFGTVFIERQMDAKPTPVTRGVKSIFKPKAAQILRVLLREPDRAWRVVDLAKAARVSLGLVSNIRSQLFDREWIQITEDGLRLSNPSALLDAWRLDYKPTPGMRFTFYTALHGEAFDTAMRGVLRDDVNGTDAVLASFAAARWLAPYGRVSTQYFYAKPAGLERLHHGLELSPVSSGANVVVTVPKDEGVFLDSTEPASGVICTSPVQTYLDLTTAGERGIESAEHLKRKLLSWQ